MVKWTFEPGHTAAEFRARHMMVTYVRGHFKDVHGSLEFDPGSPRNSGNLGGLRMSRPSPCSKAQKFDLITQSLTKFAHRLRFSVVAKRKGAEVDRDARVRLQQIMDVGGLGE